MTIHKNYINGEWVDGAEIIVNVNPSDLDDTIGEYAQADARQTADAIAAAQAAFRSWARTTPQQRADALDALGTEILARREALGELLCGRKESLSPTVSRRQCGRGRSSASMPAKLCAATALPSSPSGPASR